MARIQRTKTPATMKVTVRLREPLWRAARVRALEEHGSFQDLVTRALRFYLKTPMKKRREGATR